MNFVLLSASLAICRLEPTAPLPDGWDAGEFSSATRNADELSVVCDPAAVPEGARHEPGWRALKLVGPFDFDQVGVLAPIASDLAEAGISMLPIATFDTDYVLIQQRNVDRAVALLREKGHTVEGAS